ncbi:hypothetical protein EV643_12891 [Kribbella sp. VKM Ac-2527]|uniref:Uncharacterized protein n=1 Tax=Kribbella caucasensis TaxID=2512215 RepID=A0A4R6JI36_9ACTN|nr:hypothetical protein EV643_12891 [Kribbella sp. VKM Ac-2527]
MEDVARGDAGDGCDLRDDAGIATVLPGGVCKGSVKVSDPDLHLHRECQ